MVGIGPGGMAGLQQLTDAFIANRKSPDGWLSDVKKGHGCEIQITETMYQSFEEYWMMGLRLCEGRP